jgi:alanine racemase
MSNKILNSIQNSTSSFVGNAAAIKLDNISIDSRSLQNGLQTLFFALVGPNNAHIHQGVDCSRGQNFVVTHIPEDVKEMLISLLSKILRVLYKNLQPIIAAFNFLSSG